MWLSMHAFRRKAEPLVLWRLYDTMTTEERELKSEGWLLDVIFGQQGRALGLGECGIDECFLFCEMLMEHRDDIMADGRASMEEFARVAAKWYPARHNRPTNWSKYDNQIFFYATGMY